MVGSDEEKAIVGCPERSAGQQKAETWPEISAVQILEIHDKAAERGLGKV
ncbi:MAG: hypothetical protein V1676_04745 [Candidatus Diapherotrites archaeon]